MVPHVDELTSAARPTIFRNLVRQLTQVGFLDLIPKSLRTNQTDEAESLERLRGPFEPLFLRGRERVWTVVHDRNAIFVVDALPIVGAVTKACPAFGILL
jgi:hypothetical protein